MKAKLNNYTCKICKERYRMDKVDYAKRGRYPTAKTCTSDECELESIRQWRAKQKAKKIESARKAWSKKKEVYKKELGIKPKDHQDNLQKKINKIVRLLDKDQRCLARPEFNNTVPLEAGHIYSIGSNPALRYHLWNIHGQTNFSNCIKGGETHLMLEGILRRYGKEKLEYVESLRTLQELKLSKSEKLEIGKIANSIIKELQKGIELTRDEINQRLGIYKN